MTVIKCPIFVCKGYCFKRPASYLINSPKYLHLSRFFDHLNRAQEGPILEPDSRGILIKMKPIFDVKQIRLSDFLKPLRVSFPQSFSEIRDNWEPKVVGGKNTQSGNI